MHVPIEIEKETSAPVAIAIRDLSKIYPARKKNPSKQALFNVGLTIPQGTIFGLLGPNGAGKSTLIGILSGLTDKTSGSVLIDGVDIDRDRVESKRRIGVVPQELNLDSFFTPREILELQAGMFGVAKPRRRTDELLAMVGLSDKANAYARSLSGGMKRRLMVAKAMVHNPKILVLDEPTAGVDIELRHQLWAAVRTLNEQGTTIVLTTHYLEEAQEMCREIGIINHGRVIACEPTHQLLNRMDQRVVKVTLADEPHAATSANLPALANFQPTWSPESRILTLTYRRESIYLGRILSTITGAGFTIDDLQTSEPDLEDIFLALTQNKNR